MCDYNTTGARRFRQIIVNNQMNVTFCLLQVVVDLVSTATLWLLVWNSISVDCVVGYCCWKVCCVFQQSQTRMETVLQSPARLVSAPSCMEDHLICQVSACITQVIYCLDCGSSRAHFVSTLLQLNDHQSMH